MLNERLAYLQDVLGHLVKGEQPERSPTTVAIKTWQGEMQVSRILDCAFAHDLVYKRGLPHLHVANLMGVRTHHLHRYLLYVNRIKHHLS